MREGRRLPAEGTEDTRKCKNNESKTMALRAMENQLNAAPRVPKCHVQSGASGWLCLLKSFYSRKSSPE